MFTRIFTAIIFLSGICMGDPGPAAAPEPKNESIRIEEDATTARLQTAIATWEKDGVRVDLIGAIHIADKAYYETLNQTFTNYESLLFEMVGGEKLGPQKEPAPAPKKEKSSLSSLGGIYAATARYLELTSQSNVIDYHAENFVHADLTLAEFEEKQKQRNESMLGLMLKASFQSAFQPRGKQPDSERLLAAMMLGRSDWMKLELMKTLGQGDDQITAFTGDTVIITDRNAKCLEVLDAEIAKGRKKIGVFYGAAHFPDIEKTLTTRGWKRTNTQWLTAWDVTKPVKKAAAEKEAVLPPVGE